MEETTEESIRETERWLAECGRFSHVRPMLTPRFTPSCTDELMAWLGKTAEEEHLPIQSHLSENDREIEWVRQLHPDCRQYWETYAKFGLWNDRTLMAHCVWSDERERAAMKDAGVTVVHCPDSNVNVCSGTAPVRAMLEEGMKVALGSDIAGGDHLNMFDVTASAIRASKVRQMTDPAPSRLFDGAGGVVSGHLRRCGLLRGGARALPPATPSTPWCSRTTRCPVPSSDGPGTVRTVHLPPPAGRPSGGVERRTESVRG